MMSGKLSGTFQTGKQLATRISDRIVIVDCKSCSIAQGLIVLEAAREARQGKPLSSIVEAAQRRSANTRSFLCVETLKYLVRGGRLGRLRGLIGKMLGVKPILTFDADGALQPAGKALRGRSVHDAMLEKVVECASSVSRPKIGISHADARGIADRFANELTKRTDCASILITPLSPVMGVHGGKNCIGVAILDEHQ
jgi:hypothetical protein